MVEHIIWLICTDYETKTGKNTVRCSQNIHICGPGPGWYLIRAGMTRNRPWACQKLIFSVSICLGHLKKHFRTYPQGRLHSWFCYVRPLDWNFTSKIWRICRNYAEKMKNLVFCPKNSSVNSYKMYLITRNCLPIICLCI